MVMQWFLRITLLRLRYAGLQEFAPRGRQGTIRYQYDIVMVILVSSLLLKDVPEELHSQLREQAKRHHRSMNKEAIAVLEAALAVRYPSELPPPVHVKKPLSAEMLTKARQQGRA
jgi:plasmid stability protein